MMVDKKKSLIMDDSEQIRQLAAELKGLLDETWRLAETVMVERTIARENAELKQLSIEALTDMCLDINGLVERLRVLDRASASPTSRATRE